jgi:Uma2 family endonuclease
MPFMATVSPLNSPLTQASVYPAGWTAADMREQLGGIPLERILVVPPPGTATVDDVERIRDATGRICELLDGTLVAKTVGYFESRLAVVLSYFIERHLDTARLGMVLGSDGTLNILARVVRAADVSFISWQRLPGGELPKQPIPELVPDLAVEVLSKSNTKAEMQRKLWEYFQAGVRLVWFIDPPTRTATVYTTPEQGIHVPRDGVLLGEEVLPGFELSLEELFARAEPPKPGTDG